MKGSFRIASIDAKSCRVWSTRKIGGHCYAHGVKPFPRGCKFPIGHALCSVYSNRIDLRQFPREFSSNNPTGPTPIDGKNATNETKVKRDKSETKASSSLVETNLNNLLESYPGSWTHKDRSLARSVLADILSRLPEEHKNQVNDTNAFSDATRLLIRWTREYLVQNNSLSSKQQGSNNQQSSENADKQGILKYLIRVLNLWRRCLERPAFRLDPNRYRKGSSRSVINEGTLSEPTGRALELLQTFYESDLLSMTSAGNFGQTLASDLAFSTIFEILGSEIKINPASAQLCLAKADLMLEHFLSSNNTTNKVVWNSYLQALAKSSEFVLDSPEKAEHLVLREEALATKSLLVLSDVARTKLFSFHPDAKSYAIVLRAWADSKRSDSSDRALQFLEAIRSKDRSALDTVCYNTCIRALGQAGRGQKAEDLLWKVHQEYIQGNGEGALVQPNHFTFLAAIDGWSRSGQPERAKALLDKMISLQQNNPLYSDYLYPTTEMFTSVMSAYARHRKNSGPHVEAVLRRMEQSYAHPTDVGAPADNSKLCKPSRLTYTAAIRAWATTNHPDAPERAEAIFNQMLEYGDRDADLLPNTIAYTTLIQAWANSKRDDAPHRAMAILRRMIESGDNRSAPNTITYNTVIGAFANKGMAREAHDLLDQLIASSLQSESKTNPVAERVAHPNASTFATVLRAYLWNRSPDSGKRAHEVLVQMERWLDQKKGHVLENVVFPTSEAYVHAMHVLRWSNLIEEAEGVLWDMVKRYELYDGQPHIAVQPDVHVCNAVLSTWSYSNESCAPDRAQRIWDWMDEQNAAGKYKNIRPDAKTVVHFIEILGKSKMSSANLRIEELFDEVRNKYPDLLNAPLLQPLLERYGKSNNNK